MNHAITIPDAGVSEVKSISAISSLTAAEEQILTVDVADEALEIAGMRSSASNFTWGVCTLDQAGCPS
jgi:hypothetical protein